MKSTNFEKAFDSIGEALANLGKGVEEIIEGLVTEKENEEGSRIRIKKGSKIFLGKGVYVKLLNDVDAEIADEPEVTTSKTDKTI
jgi:hypothetical protein